MLQDDRLLVPLIMSPSEQYRKEWHGGRCRGAARTFERETGTERWIPDVHQ